MTKKYKNMGRLVKDFKRFPHTCRICTVGEPTPFSDGEEIVVWEGVCRKELMSSGTGHDYVIKADYRVQLGKVENGKEVGAIVEGILAGMVVTVTDLQGTHELTVKDAYAGQLGTSVFCDKANN